MASPASHAVLAAALILILILIATTSQATETALDWGTTDHTVRWCTGTVEECTGTRRELWGSNYIGYNALRHGSVPCSWRGASYYNCRPGAQANPYSRGCSSITQCRG